MVGRAAAALLVLASCGCGSSEGARDEPDAAVDAGVDAPAEPEGCAPGETTLDDGSCRAAGVPEDGCGIGFRHDGAGGCSAVLPAEPCGEGEMAIPGEEVCHPVTECGEGTWGAIAVEDDTVFVDAAYAGGDGNGSLERPYVRVQDAVDHAPPGAIVAIAAGRYEETVLVLSRPVRLWGVCPSLVEIVGATEYGGVHVEGERASGSGIRGVALSGISNGVEVTGASDVVVEEVWIHDALLGGLAAFDWMGPTSVTLRRSLIERVAVNGIGVQGARVTVEGVAVRDTQFAPPEAGLGRGYSTGLMAFYSDATAARPDIEVRTSLFERNGAIGLLMTGGDLLVESTLVRDDVPSSGIDGFGIVAQIDDLGRLERASLTVRSSVVEGNADDAIEVLGSDAVLENTVAGRVADWDAPSTGRGIVIGDSYLFEANATGTVRSCLVDRAREVGVLVVGADVTIESTAVRDTGATPDGSAGDGMVIQDDDSLGIATHAVLRNVRVERNLEAGIETEATELHIEDSAIVDTRPAENDQRFGDGLLAWADAAPVAVTVSGSLVAGSARAGVASFGAEVSLGSSVLDCNTIHLDGERWGGVSASFSDEGEMVCGCDGEPVPCQILSSSLEPPDPIDLGF